jgi:hypothetical protein
VIILTLVAGRVAVAHHATSTPLRRPRVKRSILVLCLLLVSLLVSQMAGATTGFQLGVPRTNVPNDPHVSGMRLSFIWGKNSKTEGFDLGVLSMSETGTFSGLALVGGVSKITGRMDGGVAFALINYHTGSDSGVNGAFINILNETGEAFNTGFVIIAKGNTNVDLGGVNVSKSSNAQIGFINVTKRIKTFQFGFINMAQNGFLPIFPIFNFPK